MVIENPATVLGEDIEIRSTVRDGSGVYAMAAKRVRIVWGAPICGTFDGDGSVRSPDAGPTPPDPDAGGTPMDAGSVTLDAGSAPADAGAGVGAEPP